MVSLSEILLLFPKCVPSPVVFPDGHHETIKTLQDEYSVFKPHPH